MDTTEWLEQYAPGFQGLSLEAREAIMHFSFLWSLFEFEALNKNGNVPAIDRVVRQWRDAGLFTDDDPFAQQLAYFRDRFYLDGVFTSHFLKLHFRKRDKRDLVEKVLRNETTDRAEIVEALLMIVYRFRNNLFHGEKWAYQLQGQIQNFDHANDVLMRAIDLQRRATELQVQMPK